MNIYKFFKFGNMNSVYDFSQTNVKDYFLLFNWDLKLKSKNFYHFFSLKYSLI